MQVAPFDVPVLIEGETGTGKELFSRCIHLLSRRRSSPFVAINCAALPRELLESELFGHCRGAFTGALKDQAGLVEEAAGGSLFLDEISSLPPELQSKLLRFLDSQEFRRVGERRLRQANVRILAASNENLREVENFRPDLYYRVAVFPLELPPLRERGDDVLSLADHFLDKWARKLGVDRLHLAPSAQAALRAHSWPGNVRELQNVLTQVVIESSSKVIEARHLSSLRQASDAPTAEMSADELITAPFKQRKAECIDAFEKRYLDKLLTEHEGNISSSSRAAGKHRRALSELLKKHRIDASKYRVESS